MTDPYESRLEAKSKVLDEISDYASDGIAEELKSEYAPKPKDEPVLSVESVEASVDVPVAEDGSGADPIAELLAMDESAIKALLGDVSDLGAG